MSSSISHFIDFLKGVKTVDFKSSLDANQVATKIEREVNKSKDAGITKSKGYLVFKGVPRHFEIYYYNPLIHLNPFLKGDVYFSAKLVNVSGGVSIIGEYTWNPLLKYVYRVFYLLLSIVMVHLLPQIVPSIALNKLLSVILVLTFFTSIVFASDFLRFNKNKNVMKSIDQKLSSICV